MKKKWIAVMGLSVFIVIAGSGCAKEQDSRVTSMNQESLEDRKSQENSALQEDEIADADMDAQSNGIEPTTDSESVKPESLSGNVRGIGDNGIVIIKIRSEKENGVDLAVAPTPGYETEEDYVSVNFTDQTKIERYVVKNNGINPDEDITVQQASLSDIKDDMSVTLEGYYEGNVFVAEKVVLYEFV